MIVPVLLGCLLAGSCVAQNFLARSGKDLRYNGEKVFMSSMNIAWHNYGMDFGNGRYDCCTGQELESYIDRIADEGGNSLRIWIHCDADFTPAFNGDGYVTGVDGTGTMATDLSRFLTKAMQRNIMVFPVLWNGAIGGDSNYMNLFWDDDKLDSYIDNALRPLVRALTQYPSLGAWEVMNEPEGMVRAGQSDSNSCFDTTPLAGTGAGWSGMDIPMYNLLRFINRQAAAIKEEDPKALVTIGSWAEQAQTDSFGFRNYYKDSCLSAAGGMSGGTVDIQQMHTYSWEGAFASTSPFKVHESEYDLDKPLIIGEFSQDCSENDDITEHFNYAYYHGYAGVWSWQANEGGHCSDDFQTQARGLNWLQGRNDQDNGGRVDFEIKLRKIKRSWGKRPTLLYNPDDMLEAEEAKKAKEAEEQAAREKAAQEEAAQRKAETEEL